METKAGSPTQCVQCEDEGAATCRCETCGDSYCGMCFEVLHRRGKRALHPRIPLPGFEDGGGGGGFGRGSTASGGNTGGAADSAPAGSPGLIRQVSGGIASAAAGVYNKCFRGGGRRAMGSAGGGGGAYEPDVDMDADELSEWFSDRARYIPLRLSYEERKVLRLVKAVMSTSDYVTLVDAPGLKPNKRAHALMQSISAVLSGLVVASDYDEGMRLVESRRFSDYQEFFQSAFEVARRHKVMNPEKMRTEYVGFEEEAGGAGSTGVV